MTIYLIRHGETDWNRELKIQGQADIPLNEAGRAQARLAAEKMAGIPVDIAYTSPLKRSQETAELFLAGRENCPLHTNQLLKEISYGVREGQSLPLIYKCPLLRLHNYFQHPEKYIPPRGGETIQELKARCRSFLEEEVYGCESRVSSMMIFTHGAFIKAAVSIVNQLPDRDFWAGAKTENCSVTAMKLKDGRLSMLNSLE